MPRRPAAAPCCGKLLTGGFRSIQCRADIRRSPSPPKCCTFGRRSWLVARTAPTGAAGVVVPTSCSRGIARDPSGWVLPRARRRISSAFGAPRQCSRRGSRPRWRRCRRHARATRGPVVGTPPRAGARPLAKVSGLDLPRPGRGSGDLAARKWPCPGVLRCGEWLNAPHGPGAPGAHWQSINGTGNPAVAIEQRSNVEHTA